MKQEGGRERDRKTVTKKKARALKKNKNREVLYIIATFNIRRWTNNH